MTDMKRPFVQADALALPFADGTFDLTCGSPPYIDARKYLEGGRDIGISRKTVAWVEWMVLVTMEAVRVTSGAVIWIVAGKTKARDYQPAPEGLVWEWYKRGGVVYGTPLGKKPRNGSMYRPCYWHRVGIAGSGGNDWFRSDVEYALCFKRPGELAWTDNTACGHPPKYAPGGEMSHRLTSGMRVNQWGPGGMGARRANGDIASRERPSHVTVWGNMPSNGGRRANGDPKKPYLNGRSVDRLHTKREPDGSMREQGYTAPVLANPGNLLRVKVGGGHMGHPLAHENEACYPEGVPEFFIKSLCKPGGRVLDCFSGSGTTVAVARKLGRIGIGCDLRMSQCELGVRRLATPYAKKVKKPRVAKPEPTLFAQVPA